MIAEHKLGTTGIIDESTAPALGKIIGAAALVVGRIQTDKYAEETSSGDPWRDKQGKYHRSHYREGLYTLIVNVNVIDMQTAKILAVKTLSTSYRDSTSADNETPPQINKNELYTRCIDQTKQQFLRLVAPYTVQVKAKFQTDKMLPEVDSAIAQFRIGEWDTGMKLLESAINKPGLEIKIRAKTYYNLGLAQTYRGQFAEALENLKKAMELMPNEKAYQNAILQAKKEKAQADKLKEQI